MYLEYQFHSLQYFLVAFTMDSGVQEYVFGFIVLFVFDNIAERKMFILLDM